MSAEGWIKFEKNLISHPVVLRMASRLCDGDVTLMSRNKLVALGALVTFWSYADAHIGEDNVLPIGADQVDQLVGLTGFCEMLPAKWLKIVDADSVELVDYIQHNGPAAKQRALGQKRQERYRNNGAVTRQVTQHRDMSDGSIVTGASLEKSREEKNKNKSKSASKPREVFDPSKVEGLDVDAWHAWLKYRAERKPAIKPVSMQTAAEELAAFGADQVAVVRQSIANGWQGLFAIKTNGNGAAHSGAPLTKFERIQQIQERALREGH